MKILLVSPVKDIKHRTNKGLMMPQLALYLIEGLTPKEHEVKIVEEEFTKLNMDEDCDLVGISTMTANAPRAYHLAREFPDDLCNMILKCYLTELKLTSNLHLIFFIEL